MLKKISYSEYHDEDRYWKLESCDFIGINLIVGRNATGKSRLINVTSALCDILAARNTTAYDSGKFEAEFTISTNNYSVVIEFQDKKVVQESLTLNGEKKLTRNADGSGAIYYAEKGEFIDFLVPKNVIAFQQRRDELQHPFIAELANWAAGSQKYLFAKSSNQETLVAVGQLSSTRDSENSTPNAAENLVSAYTTAYQLYGDEFDTAIVRDMCSLDYKISEVHTADMREFLKINLAEPVIGLVVRETDRNTNLPQMHMSQGLFRALDLVIRMQIASFSKQHNLILVDDIGEGLDHERSVALIQVLIKQAESNGIQLIFTSNDRFVMNKVALKYWTFLKRRGAVVSSHSERSDPKQFDEFKFMGLSNFDFFTSATFDKN
jgi:predicted ATPase